jgi:hypothetical protein
MALTEAEATVVALAIAASVSAIGPAHYAAAVHACCLCAEDASLLRLPVSALVRRWEAGRAARELRPVLAAARDELARLRSPGVSQERTPASDARLGRGFTSGSRADAVSAAPTSCGTLQPSPCPPSALAAADDAETLLVRLKVRAALKRRRCVVLTADRRSCTALLSACVPAVPYVRAGTRGA